MSQKPKGSHSALTVVLTVLIVLMLAATVFLVYLCIDLVNKEADVKPSQDSSLVLPTQPSQPETTTVPETTVPPTTEAPEPEHVVATASVGIIGDLLMHSPIFKNCQQADGSYNFESVFRYGKDLFTSYDYAIANLETTFGGPSHPHIPNQAYCCPDELATSAKEAGFDMFQTINNHAGDSSSDGLIRTIETTRAAGLATLGTQLPGEKRYSVVDINGIQVGMVAYSWAFGISGNSFSLNGYGYIKDEGQANYFSKSNPDKLYNELKPILEGMKEDGAEVTMILIHWGEEYEIKENAAEDKMAQKLCDLGFDVIVGGHPHVVQPMALLQSTENPEHKAYCIYSLGNAVSNQRIGMFSKTSRYTESGVLFNATFEKYSDGKVYVAGIDAIPTWVNMHSKNGKREYNILPLVKDKEEQWKTDFDLTDNELTAAQDSYAKTMKIIGEGLTACQEDLAQAKTDREAYYQNLAEHPELATQAQTQPVATVPETTPETTVAEAA